MPVLSPDLVTPSAAVADTIASPAVTVASLSAPGSPTGLVAVPGNARVSLTWSAPLSNGGARISDYVVQYSSDTGTSWTTFADRVSAATSATVTGLSNGTSYVFRVAAANAAGIGAPSDATSAVAPRKLPGVPTGLVGVPGDGLVGLSWVAPVSDGGAAITDYCVQISGDRGKNWATVDDGVSAATSATVKGLTNGTSYVFRVAAVNAAGTGTSFARSATLTPRTVPLAPGSVVAVPGNARVNLTWSAPLSNGGARISDYVVQYSSDTGTTWTTFADRVSAATSATVTGLTNGASYLFRVAAVNAAGTGDPSARSASFVPATFGGFSELSAPEQMATGTAVPISGRVFDPTGTAVDAIHVYRDADGNGDLDPGIDQLLHVDTTPGSGFEFDTSTLASGVHRIIVAATNAGSVVGSTPLTVTASDWWEMSIGPRTHGEAGFTASGELSTGLPQGVGKPVYVAPGTNINDAWIAAVKEHVSGTIGISNHDWLDPYAYTFGPGAFRVGVRGALATEVANDPRATDTFDINLPDDTKLIVLEDLSAAADLDNDFDYDDQYWVVTWSPLLVDLDVTPREVDEDGSRGLVYTFTRSVATASALTVGYAVDGTATAGNDYTGLPLGAGVKTITIPANQRTASVTVFPTPDSEIEPDETVVITLQNGTGYAVGAKSIATGTILNDDLPGTVTGRGWFDVNDDGSYDAPESPLSGVVVNLFDSLGSPALDASLQPVAPNTIDAGATYRFPNLRPGSYTVAFTDTVGYLGPGTAGAVYAGIATVQLAQTAIVDLLFSQVVIPEEPQAPPAPPTAETLDWEHFEDVDTGKDPNPKIVAQTGWKLARTFPGRAFTFAAVVDQQGTVKATGRFNTPPNFRAVFNAADSWVVKGEQSPQLLEHERLHLRIAEYIAEKANLNFSETLQNITADGVGQAANPKAARDIAKATASQNLAAAFTDFYNDWEKKDKIITKLYDDETVHGTIPEKQADWDRNWEQRVDTELKRLGWTK